MPKASFELTIILETPLRENYLVGLDWLSFIVWLVQSGLENQSGRMKLYQCPDKMAAQITCMFNMRCIFYVSFR